MAVPPVTVDVLVVFGVVAATISLFVTELLPSDVTAIALVVVLVVLEPWTGVGPNAAISGFSSPATVTILAMFILSAGVQETGTIRRLGAHVAAFTHGDGRRVLGTTVGITAPLAGFINNTPVVAMFVPMVTDLADDSHVSPSKLLIPLSYASMLGGVLTLIGTSTNLLASDIAATLAATGDYPLLVGRVPFSMFQFTPLGVVVLLVGLAYLVTVGQWLLPARIEPVDLTDEFGMEPYLWRVLVRSPSPVVGQTVEEAMSELDLDIDILQVVRGDETFIGSASNTAIRERDVLTVRGREEAIQAFVGLAALRRLPRATVTEDELAEPEHRGTLVEAVVQPDSPLAGSTVTEAALRARYGATVLAVRDGATLVHDDLPAFRLSEGTGLLLYAPESAIDYLTDDNVLAVTEVANPNGLVGATDELPPFFATKGPVAVGIVGAVVALAAMGALPISIAALGGVVAMIVTGVLDAGDAYDAVSWEIIFLLAGVIPLGVALERSGGAAFLAELVVANTAVLPALAVLALFYLLTGLLANVITPVASLVLMLPIAVDAAGSIGAHPFAFVLGVTFAASTAFMTPIGYQTNLMVYSAGGYRFSDFVRAGAPLQLLLAVVTPVAIDLIWTV